MPAEAKADSKNARPAPGGGTPAASSGTAHTRPHSMSHTASPPLTERQEARRRRILHASAQLASRGGFDAVQMREVAESSQVALGTLYRYFPSKVHLLVATMQDQLEHMHGTLRKKPPAGDSAAEKFTSSV